MPSPHTPAAGGGVLVAIGAIGGAGVGLVFGEATPGFLVGLAIGTGAAALIAWRGRS